MQGDKTRGDRIVKALGIHVKVLDSLKSLMIITEENMRTKETNEGEITLKAPVYICLYFFP